MEIEKLITQIWLEIQQSDSFWKKIGSLKLLASSIERKRPRFILSGFDVDHNQEYIIKIIRNESRVLTEVETVLSLKDHKNIIQFERVTHLKRMIEPEGDIENWSVICMKRAEGGDLVDYMSQKGRFSEGQVRLLFVQVLESLEFLHSSGFVHRDVKLDNLLVDSNGQVILTDFEYCKKVHKHSIFTSSVGTLLYSAPEMREGLYKGFTVDMWAAGVTLYCLLFGCFPFSVQCLEEMREEEWIQELDHDPTISSWCKHLLKGLLELDPTKRLTAGQALAHPWCTGRFATNPLDKIRARRQHLNATSSKNKSNTLLKSGPAGNQLWKRIENQENSIQQLDLSSRSVSMKSSSANLNNVVYLRM